MSRIHWLSRQDPPDAFPPPESALQEPDGLLAAGGDLSVERLLCAYERGIFPWYEEGQPILWWSPDPRAILRPDAIHISRSLRRSMRRTGFRVSFNRSFPAVIEACATPRPGQGGTWITRELTASFLRLHERGWAHSVEIWREGKLAGGLYGLAMGQVFFGESMFSAESDASKTAMVALCKEMKRCNFAILDCQVVSPHLLSMGAERRPRAEFLEILKHHCRRSREFADLPADSFSAARLSGSCCVANKH